jgi:hypothetical protein
MSHACIFHPPVLPLAGVHGHLAFKVLRVNMLC